MYNIKATWYDSGTDKYNVDMPTQYEERGKGGMYDLATDIVHYIRFRVDDFSSNIDSAIEDIYNTLQRLRYESIAYGFNTQGVITREKASEWTDMFETVSNVLNNPRDLSSYSAKEKADYIVKLLTDRTGFKVQCDYDENYPYYDFEVWYKDGSFGLRIFMTPDDNGNLKLSKDFYGYQYGDDSIFEDLSLESLSKF